MKKLKKPFKENSRLVFYIIILLQNWFIASSCRAQTNNPDADLSTPFRKCWTYGENRYGEDGFGSDNVFDITLSSEANHILYLTNNKLEYLSLDKARRIWVSDLGGETVSKLLTTGKNIFLATKSGGSYFLKNIDQASGVTNWQIELPFATTDTEFEIYLYLFEDKIIAVGRDGEIFALAKESGKLLWSTKTEKVLNTLPSFQENLIAYGTENNKLIIISANNGAKLKEFEIKSPATVIALQMSGKQIIYGDKKGGIYLLNTADNTILWKTRSGAEISDISRTRDAYLISSLDNFIYLVSADNGKRLWKKRLSGRIFYKPLILNKYAAVSSLFDASAVIIALKNGRVVNRLSLENGNYFRSSFILAGEFLVFSTAQSLTAYSSARSGCSPSPK